MVSHFAVLIYYPFAKKISKSLLDPLTEERIWSQILSKFCVSLSVIYERIKKKKKIKKQKVVKEEDENREMNQVREIEERNMGIDQEIKRKLLKEHKNNKNKS